MLDAFVVGNRIVGRQKGMAAMSATSSSTAALSNGSTRTKPDRSVCVKEPGILATRPKVVRYGMQSGILHLV